MAAGRMARRDSLLEPQDAASPQWGPPDHIPTHRIRPQDAGDLTRSCNTDQSGDEPVRKSGPYNTPPASPRH
jgi:hypothetical protein